MNSVSSFTVVLWERYFRVFLCFVDYNQTFNTHLKYIFDSICVQIERYIQYHLWTMYIGLWLCGCVVVVAQCRVLSDSNQGSCVWFSVSIPAFQFATLHQTHFTHVHVTGYTICSSAIVIMCWQVHVAIVNIAFLRFWTALSFSCRKRSSQYNW